MADEATGRRQWLAACEGVERMAAVRWASYEPALGPVDFDDRRDWLTPSVATARMHGRDVGPELDWIVVGGESGPGARPFDLAWARSTIAQCEAAGVPVFVKQLGARPIVTEDIREVMRGALRAAGHTIEGGVASIRFRDRKKGGDWTEWPEDLRVREWPGG